MQILDIILRPSDYIKDAPRHPFENTPEYREMVRRATDSLQHVQDSLRRAAADSAAAAQDTLSHASHSFTDSLSTVNASFGSLGSGDDTTSAIVTTAVALCALCASAFAIMKHRKKLSNDNVTR